MPSVIAGQTPISRRADGQSCDSGNTKIPARSPTRYAASSWIYGLVVDPYRSLPGEYHPIAEAGSERRHASSHPGGIHGFFEFLVVEFQLERGREDVHG